MARPARSTELDRARRNGERLDLVDFTVRVKRV
jgi:hypothetical protein